MDWNQPGGSESRGSILFAGGRGDFIEKYLEIYAHWHALGWNVTAFDWRSQGGSRGSIVGGHLDTLDLLVDDFCDLIEDWAAAQARPHVVVGHSMGGHVLLRILAERQPPIEAAILVAPMIEVNSAPLPKSAARLAATFYNSIGWSRVPIWKDTPSPPGSARQYHLTSCPERYMDEAWWWEREPGFNLGAPSWAWMLAAYRSSDELTDDRLASIRVPLLLIGTERDRLVSAEAIRRTAHRVPGARLKMFADAGHEILREADPVRLEALAAIDRFLDEHAG